MLGVRRQAERSLSIPKGKAIAQSAAVGGLVEKQVDNRWSKCIVVKYVQENGISFTLLCVHVGTARCGQPLLRGSTFYLCQHCPGV